MHKDIKRDQHTSAASAAVNQGEGDTQSAERFNKEEKDFVQSEHGQKVIGEAGQVTPAQQAALEQAERDGLSRTKGDDPAVTRKP